MSRNGKGSKQRPKSPRVSREEFAKNWERTWSRQSKKDERSLGPKGTKVNTDEK